MCSPASPQRHVEPRPSLFGLNLRDVPHDRWDRIWEAASPLHPKWVRLDGQVALDETGKLDFAFYDRWVHRFRSEGVGVLGELGGTKASCTRGVMRENTVNCPPDPARNAVYADYVERVTRHFAGSITYWESWNEPDQERYWLTGPNPSAYATVLHIQHAAMKRGNAEAKLIFAATATGNESWIARVLAVLDGERPYEAIALHPYRFGGPHDSALFARAEGSVHSLDMKSELRERVSLFRQYDLDHGRPEANPEVWLTEYGWGAASQAGDDLAGGVKLVSYATQARYLRELITLLQTDPDLAFVKAAFWWSVIDLTWPGDEYAFFKSYGLLRGDLTRKPAAETFAELAARSAA
jgi:hypothetical protein